MSQTSNRFSVSIESNNFLKTKNEPSVRPGHSGSLGDLSRPDFKHPNAQIHRDDSISSKSSFTSLFKKSFEGSINGVFTPRPEKALGLFETILMALNEMHNKYSNLKCMEVDVETQDYNEICIKLHDRINLIQNLKADYNILTEDKQTEFNKIESNFRSYLSNKHSKEPLDVSDNESYWSICKELFITESKLEKCSGKLQFQIMELDFIGKINPLDQYELSIRLNETTKFKTRIKIEKNGHQLWDSRTFAINPVVDDFLCIKFSEIKSLNKSVVLSEKKLPFINNLIRSEPSIFTLWLSPVGTIKLKVIVQWNSMLEDPNLQMYLTGIDNKFSDQFSKNEVSLRSRSASHKYTHNRISANIESLFRSSRLNPNSRSNSMDYIAEDAEEEKIAKERGVLVDTRFSDTQVRKTEVKTGNQDFKEKVEKFPNITINIIEEDKIAINDKEKSNVLLKQERIDIELSTAIPVECQIIEMRSHKDESNLRHGFVNDQSEEIKIDFTGSKIGNINTKSENIDSKNLSIHDNNSLGDTNNESIGNKKENIESEIEGIDTIIKDVDTNVENIDIKKENIGANNEDLITKYENIKNENIGANNEDIITECEIVKSENIGADIEDLITKYENIKNENISADIEDIITQSESVKNENIGADIEDIITKSENIKNENIGADIEDLITQSESVKNENIGIDIEDINAMDENFVAKIEEVDIISKEFDTKNENISTDIEDTKYEKIKHENIENFDSKIEVIDSIGKGIETKNENIGTNMENINTNDDNTHTNSDIKSNNDRDENYSKPIINTDYGNDFAIYENRDAGKEKVGDKNENPDHSCLSLKDMPPSHIFGCEDNGQVIESPIIHLISHSSINDDGNEESIKNDLVADSTPEEILNDSSRQLNNYSLLKSPHATEDHISTEPLTDLSREEDRPTSLGGEANIGEPEILNLSGASEIHTPFTELPERLDSLAMEISVIPTSPSDSTDQTCSLLDVEETRSPLV